MTLRLDLNPTKRRSQRVGASGASEFFAMDWLSLEGTLADGSLVKLTRREELEWTHQYYGRTQRWTWSYAFVDGLSLAFPQQGSQYRAVDTAAQLGPHLAASLDPLGCRCLTFQAAPHRIELGMRGAARWYVPSKLPSQHDAVDASALALGWVAQAYALAGSSQPPILAASEPRTTWVMPITATTFGWLLLLLSGPPFFVTALGARDTLETYQNGWDDLARTAALTALFALIGLGLLVGAALLWVLPRRLARRPA